MVGVRGTEPLWVQAASGPGFQPVAFRSPYWQEAPVSLGLGRGLVGLPAKLGTPFTCSQQLSTAL